MLNPERKVASVCFVLAVRASDGAVERDARVEGLNIGRDAGGGIIRTREVVEVQVDTLDML